MIEVHKIIYHLHIHYNLTFKDDSFELDYNENALKEINKFNNTPEILQNNKYIKIYYRDLNFDIYQTGKDFLKINKIKSLKDTLILDYDGSPLSYIDGKPYRNFQDVKNYYYFDNAISYVDFIDFLKSKECEDEAAFHFIDYFNKDLRKIVLTSLSEKSRLIIKYENDIPLFNPLIDYSNFVISFKNCFGEDNNHLPKFLKNSLIQFALKYNQNERMELIFINLDNVIYHAKVNFEVYLNNLSVEKIKKDYDDYKSKYFDELSSILSKITQQIIGLPVGISATLFAISKINDNTSFLLVLLIILLITSIYLSLLLKINYKDLKYLDSIFEQDYETLMKNNFFIKYPNELNYFNEIKGRIADRIKFLNLIIESYYWILNISNVLIIGFILKYLNLTKENIIFISVIEVLTLLIIRDKILSKE